MSALLMKIEICVARPKWLIISIQIYLAVAHHDRMVRARVMEAEHAKLENRVNKEKQFNRRVELNAQLRGLKSDLDSLRR